MIEVDNHGISIRRQCEILGLNRSSLYYEPAGMTDYNLLLMDLIDKQYTETPYYGIRRMTEEINNKGYKVNRKRVRRLMRLMGLEAIYPRRNLSKAAKAHKVYPYLLKGVNITQANQVWSADITYIRMARGFVYLVAIMDWWSRYVLAWNALKIATPEIFNTDQGSQFAAKEFIDILLGKNIRVSMDGRDRVFDNIFIERLWRTLKYEEVYLKDYADVWDAEKSIADYFRFYNNKIIKRRGKFISA